MPYIYGISDTKFKVTEKKKNIGAQSEVPPVKYHGNAVVARPPKFDHNIWPIQFRFSPASLVELCVDVVNKKPLPSIFEWNDKDIRLWICRYGYPQYMNTFRVNMIWGRKLLLLDADALCSMNIKDFEHIKHITYGIRMLFHFELTKFSQSISLPDEKPNELYLLWHSQTGVNYDAFRRSDLCIRMRILRERSLYLDHWDLLELWLRRERERKYTELIALVPQYNMYKCAEKPVEVARKLPLKYMSDQLVCCICMPPCDCEWSDRDTRPPRRLECLNAIRRSGRSRNRVHEGECSVCIPPCECRWPSRYYLTGSVLGCLKQQFPDKFAPSYEQRIAMKVRPSVLENWTRFSF